MYEQRIAGFVVLLAGAALVLWGIRQARAGNVLSIRRMAALEAIDECVGRATEMGSPLVFIPGCGNVTDATAMETFAGLDMLSFVAAKTAKYDTKLCAIIATANVYPMALERVKEAYVNAGSPEKFKPDEQVRFMSGDFYAYIMGTLGIMEREKPAAAVMTGYFTGDSTLVAEGSAQAGALSVSGTAHVTHVAYLVVATDYTLIGEELFAAAAAVSENKAILGSVRAQDVIKASCVVTMALGCVLATFGQAGWLTNLLSK